MNSSQSGTTVSSRTAPCSINDRFEDGGPAEGGPSKWEHTVIEDIARAHFAEYNKKWMRTYGTAGTFSYYPGKISVLTATPELS